MGWTGTNRPSGQPLREFFSKEFGMGAHTKNVFLDFATVKRTTCYAAVKDTETGEVFGLVILVRYSPNDYYNITYKDMTEDMGPNESECPHRILDLLTPTTSKYALAWRERCRNRPKAPKVGDLIKFETPLDFVGYGTEDTFRVIRWGKAAKRYQAVNGGFLANIDRITSRKFTVEAGQ